MTGAALEQAVTDYADMVYRVAFHYLGKRTDAEDAMQETFYRLCRASVEFASEDHLKHWLIRVVINESKKLKRSAWFRRMVPLDEMQQDVAAPQQQELLPLVMMLPEKYRTVIYLYYYEGWPVKDIAAALSTKPSTIQTWLMRARERLRKSLLGGENQDG